MKKFFFISIVVIALLVGCANESERKYSSNGGWGRDTIFSFGDIDGRFAILNASKELDTTIWSLCDIKNQKTIDDIYNYKDVNPYAYTIGEKGYTKLNYNTGEYIQSKNLIDFTDIDIDIFKKLKLKDLTKKDN